MAEMKLQIAKIEAVEHHSNADRLDVVYLDINSFPVIAGRDQYRVGDVVMHFPVDCVVSPTMEEYLIGGSKMKLSDGRIRASKIRGVVSYGIVTPANKLGDKYNILFHPGVDYMEKLGCKKFEPKPDGRQVISKGIKQTSKKNSNPFFDKYFDMNHLQNCKNMFKPEDIVIVTEKCHGCSTRQAYVPRVLRWWQKLLRFNKYEFVYGSRNVQLQDKIDNSVWKKVYQKYDLKNILTNYPGYAIYGEIVGPGIQAGYDYTPDYTLWIYDVKIDGQYVDYAVAKAFCECVGLPMVPVLFTGMYKDMPDTFFNSGSVISDKIKVKEGIVIASEKETITQYGRKKVKLINPEYLLNKDNTDFH